jgi:formamidopyrimidine-DNA glycosylase
VKRLISFTILKKQKHMVNEKEGENLSFGLSGKVRVLDDNDMIKINTGWIYGEKNLFDNYDEETRKLGINLLTSSEANLQKEIDSWIKSKKMLAGLIFDQTKISGIGVAWGSEILFKVGLRHDMRACDKILHLFSSKMGVLNEKRCK